MSPAAIAGEADESPRGAPTSIAKNLSAGALSDRMEFCDRQEIAPNQIAGASSYRKACRPFWNLL